MAIYPAAGVFLLIWLALSIRNADNGVPMVMAVLPFGMFAAIVAGGLSVILANLLAILTIGLLLLRWFSQRGRTPTVPLPSAGVFLAIFAFYAVFSSFVLVRIFQGKFMVFPMSVTFKATQVSIHFPSTMWPLQPTNSNIAQSVYILLSCGFFLAVVLVLRRRGTGFAETGLAWGAGINAVLGLIDLMQLDVVLSPFRTADYSLANEHTMAGMARVIGGHAEASVFGAASAGFFGYFAMSYLMGRRSRDGALALANLACAALALSSTAVLALGAASVVILLHMRTFMNAGMSRAFGHIFVVAVAGAVLAACLLVMLTPAADLLSDLLDRLVFSKRDSLSGLERGAWAQAGFDAFVQTWGLGAGAGSLRANGLASVLLGSVGLPGTLAFIGFLIHAVGKSLQAADRDTARVFYASRVSALTLLASMIVSATGPDPTLFLMTVTAIAVVARERSARSSQSWRDQTGPEFATESI